MRLAYEKLQAMVTDLSVPMEQVEQARQAFRDLDAPEELLDRYLMVLSLAFEQRNPRHSPGD